MRRYVHRAAITVGDTNWFRNAYFTTHLKLTGAVRETWLAEQVPDVVNLIGAGLVLVTREVRCTYRRDFLLFDPVRVEMWFENILSASVHVRFEFFHDQTGLLHAEAWHQIVFAGPDHQVCRMPDSFRSACERFMPTVPGGVS